MYTNISIFSENFGSLQCWTRSGKIYLDMLSLRDLGTVRTLYHIIITLSWSPSSWHHQTMICRRTNLWLPERVGGNFVDLSSTLARDCSQFYSLPNQGPSSSYSPSSSLSTLLTFIIWIITELSYIALPHHHVHYHHQHTKTMSSRHHLHRHHHHVHCRHHHLCQYRLQHHHWHRCHHDDQASPHCGW